MARLFLILLVCATVLAGALLLGRAVKTAQEAALPDTVKTISYVLLIALMFGVVTGWFGGL